MPSIAMLTPLQRKLAYLALFVINAALVACVAQGLIPPVYAGLAQMVSLGLASAMKQLTSQSTTPKDAAKKASSRPPPMMMLCLVCVATLILGGCSASAGNGVATLAIGLPCAVMLLGALLYWVSDKPKVSAMALYAFVVGLFWTVAGAVGHAGRFLSFLCFAGLVAAFSVQACKDPMTPNNVTNGILDLEQTACVILQSELGQSEPAVVQTICKIDPALISQVVQLFTAHKKAKLSMAKLGAHAPCASIDGGAK